jgi:peptidoglycan/xylan/chitin deacetylase (PgdA/CDA1 family)
MSVLPLFLLAALVTAAEPPAPYVPPSDDQLMTLGGAKGERFPLREITWPAQPGQAEICLWQDDKYAACSITIDDNCAPDHEWWLEQTAKHGFKVTWFVVTGGVGGKNAGFNGTWEGFRKLREAGHEVQSHTISHGKSDHTRDEAEVQREYAVSKQAVEEGIPGHRCIALAYPYGNGRGEVAAGYYIAVRGVHGAPSKANSINYLNTGKGSLDPDQLNAILGRPVVKLKWLSDPGYNRGWIQPLYHLVLHGKTAEEKQASRAAAAADLVRLAAEKERIWIDTFVAVAKYGQERDSATLTTVKSETQAIELSLKDRMRDDLFDQPLSVKVRLPDAWTTVQARQGGKPIAATLVRHEDKPYALVAAVPDRGPITITSSL